MPRKLADKQEGSLTVAVALMVPATLTSTEKNALKLLAIRHNTTVASLVRYALMASYSDEIEACKQLISELKGDQANV